MPKATHLECSLCGAKYDAAAVANLCACGGPLLVRYDLGVIRHRWLRRDVASGPANMWRYAPVLPAAEASVVTPWGRLDAAGAYPPAGRAYRRGELVGEGRGAQPNGVVQGARAFLRRLDVRGTRHQEGGDSLGGQRGQRHGGLCGGGRNRSAHLHAARRSAIQLPGVQGLRRARHAGGRADQRLRPHGGRARSPAKAGSTSAR